MDNISFGLSILFSLGAATCLGLAILDDSFFGGRGYC
jgi:hypothetical protein